MMLGIKMQYTRVWAQDDIPDHPRLWATLQHSVTLIRGVEPWELGKASVKDNKDNKKQGSSLDKTYHI